MWRYATFKKEPNRSKKESFARFLSFWESRAFVPFMFDHRKGYSKGKKMRLNEQFLVKIKFGARHPNPSNFYIYEIAHCQYRLN
jgi:hypothetical protein